MEAAQFADLLRTIIRAKVDTALDEAERLDEARVIRKTRVRGGKVQRNVKVSGTKGYTYKGGKLVRISANEHRIRSRASKLSARKRRAKLRQALRKRKISLRKRKMAGLHP